MPYKQIITTITGETHIGRSTFEDGLTQAEAVAEQWANARDENGILTLDVEAGHIVLHPEHIVSCEIIDTDTYEIVRTVEEYEDGSLHIAYSAELKVKEADPEIEALLQEEERIEREIRDGGDLWPWAKHFSEAAAIVGMSLSRETLEIVLNAIADDYPWLAGVEKCPEVTIEFRLVNGEPQIEVHDHRDGQPCALEQDPTEDEVREGIKRIMDAIFGEDPQP